MGPTDNYRNDRSGEEVYGIAVDGFTVQVDAEPLPQPGLLTVHVYQIIIAAPVPETVLQPPTSRPLVVFCVADVEGVTVVAKVLAQTTPVTGQLRAGIPRTAERRNLCGRA